MLGTIANFDLEKVKNSTSVAFYLENNFTEIN